jgi:hypothetical protein
MSSSRVSCAGLAALALIGACFNPDDGSGSGGGTADTSSSGSASVSATQTDSDSDPTPGSQTMTDPSDDDPSDTDPTDPSDDDPSDTDPTDTDPTGMDSTGDVPVLCGDGIVVVGEFCPVDPVETIATGANAVDVALSDLDDAAGLDAAVLARGASTVTLLYNDGTGALAAGTTLDVSDNSCGLVAVDGEGDGDVDLAVSGGALVTLVNDGAGGFVRVDSDSDGTFGCDEHNNIDVLNNNGGPLDIAYSGAYNNSYAPGVVGPNGWQFGASSEIDPAGEGSSGVRVTEFAFDADNDPDVVVLNQYFSSAFLWGGNGMGGFVELGEVEGCQGLDGADGSRFSDAGDYDGDGAIDLVITCMEGNFVLVHGTDSVAFMPPIEVLLPGAHEPLFVDLDGDDDLDLVVTSTTQQAIEVYVNEGGPPADPLEIAVGGAARGLAVDDLNGDGAVEIVAAIDGSTSGIAIVRTDP